MAVFQVRLAPIREIIPYARNPRKNAGAIDKVAASLKEFGWRQPIVVDQEMVVIAGHTRLEAAKKLNMAQVPIHVAEGLTDAQIKAYRLADNRSGQEAEWDIDLLALEFEDLANLDVDLSLLGFEDDEIEKCLALASATSEGLTDENDIPEPPETPISVLGDVWILGKHRLVCGDCTNPEAVDKCLNGVEPHLMVTDPPYGVEYDPGWRVGLKTQKPGTSVGAVVNDDRAEWEDAWNLFPGSVAYVWHGGLNSGIVGNSLKSVGLELRSQIIWVKQGFVFGRSHYHWQHEPCWYAVRKGSKGAWEADRKQTTIWEIQNLNKIKGGNKDEPPTGHSTQKPVECMRKPIENNSSPGQAVYEPFSGSGTTIIAAEQTGRACHAIEINPEYVDIAVKRWQEYTGKQAIHENGKKFTEIQDAA